MAGTPARTNRRDNTHERANVTTTDNDGETSTRGAHSKRRVSNGSSRLGCPPPTEHGEWRSTRRLFEPARHFASTRSAFIIPRVPRASRHRTCPSQNPVTQAGEPELPEIRHLKDTLAKSLAEAMFDLGQSQPQNSATTFADIPEEIVAPDALATLLRAGAEQARRARNSQTLLSQPTRESLQSSLRAVLQPHLKSDTIGYSFPSQGDRGGATTATADRYIHSLSVTSLPHFANWTLKGAALLGTDRMAELVGGWGAGDPLRYRIEAIVSLHIDRKLSPMPGLELTPLPLSTNQLPTRLPRGSGGFETKYIGQTLLAADATVSPAVFRPGDRLLDDYDSKLTCGSDIATIAQGLSLLADSHVALGPQWDDHGDLAPLVTDHAVLGTPDDLRPVSGPTVIQDVGTTLLPNDHEVHTLDEAEICSLISCSPPPATVYAQALPAGATPKRRPVISRPASSICASHSRHFSSTAKSRQGRASALPCWAPGS